VEQVLLALTYAMPWWLEAMKLSFWMISPQGGMQISSI
jgi:hypothetical protein